MSTEPNFWPVDFGHAPEAAHAASEFTDDDNGIAEGVFLWPFLTVLAGIVVGALLAVLL